MATATKSQTKCRIKPLDDRLVIVVDDAEDRTSAGIYLPDSAQEKPMHGTVVAVGPGKANDEGQRTPLAVEAGDTVVYGKYAGTEVELDGGDFVVIRENELLAIID